MVGIAAFALIVGGIGIMNIMLATRDRADARDRHPPGARRQAAAHHLQFLIETTVISLTGGLIGITLGGGFAKALPWVVRHLSDQDYPTAIAAWSVVGLVRRQRLDRDLLRPLPGRSWRRG